MKLGCAAMIAAFGFAGGLAAQEKAAAPAAPRQELYDAAREGSLTGTVVSYTASATTAPLGAQVALRTSSGVVNIHLGDGRLLEANHFTIQAGDSLRIVGENVIYGDSTIMLARLIQKGTQVLAVRSIRGIALSYKAPSSQTNAKQGGAR